MLSYRDAVSSSRPWRAASREIRAILTAAAAHGFQITKTRKNHYLVTTAAGQFITTVPGTPSDHRAHLNCVAALRRAGLDYKP